MQTQFIGQGQCLYQRINKSSHIHVRSGRISVQKCVNVSEGICMSSTMSVAEGDRYTVSEGGWLCLTAHTDCDLLLEEPSSGIERILKYVGSLYRRLHLVESAA
ncbi:hypothetical protein [Undibacterium sp. SXout20W]|uniref:hypothetical protein n=1 Tax=Undibacterium sp. SXout20W TaxID=3413051 RepID=UPI003BF0EF16